MENNLLCTMEYQKMLQVLNNKDDCLPYFQEAISYVADSLCIGRMTLEFEVKRSLIDDEELIKNEVLYISDKGYDENDVVSRRYETSEKGCALVSIYRRKGLRWDNVLRDNVGFLIESLYVYLGRTRLIMGVRHAAVTDRLTKVPNVQGFLDFGNRIIAAGHITEYSAYYFNIRNFKLINEKYSFETGNKVLTAYVKVLTKHIDRDEIVARLGGDNFVALIKKSKSGEFTELLGNVPVSINYGDKDIKLSMSAIAGVYSIDKPVESMSYVMQSISTAVSCARNILHKDVVYYTEEMYKMITHANKIVSEFDSAINKHDFIVYYQPKVDTENSILAGAEALVRWKYNNRILQPAEFIQVLEKEGLICQLDFYVLKNVCQHINQWKVDGIEPVKISVNFSRRHLKNPNISEDIVKIVDEYGVPHDLIEIELTETSDEIEQGMMKHLVTSLNEKDITTAIDDFGTGYTSLNILRFLDVDVLKIDKSLIDRDNLNDRDLIVLGNVINMATQLGINIITEGVESQEQVEVLKKVGCTMVQGYLYDKPMDEATFREILKRKVYK